MNKTAGFGRKLIDAGSVFPIFLRYIFRFGFDDLKIMTHMSLIERMKLYDLAINVEGDGDFVEIGSYLGASSTILAAAATDLDKKVFCIDTWWNQGMSEGERDTFDIFKKNIYRFRKTIYPLRGFSVRVSEDFDEPISLLFVDGDHSYEGCYSDIQAWLPKMTSDGIVVFHDYIWSDGVKQAVQEFLREEKLEYLGLTQSLFWARVC